MPGRSRVVAGLPVDPGGGAGPGCAATNAGETPALPGGRPARMHCRWVSLSIPGITRQLRRQERRVPGRSRVVAGLPVDPGGGDGQACAATNAGETPALPGGRPASLSIPAAGTAARSPGAGRCFAPSAEQAVPPRGANGKRQPAPGARASRPHALPLGFAQYPCDVAPANSTGRNGACPAEAESWRGCRSTRVEEMGEVVPRHLRAGRPRSRGASRPHALAFGAAQFPCDTAPARPAGGHHTSAPSSTLASSDFSLA